MDGGQDVQSAKNMRAGLGVCPFWRKISEVPSCAMMGFSRAAELVGFRSLMLTETEGQAGSSLNRCKPAIMNHVRQRVRSFLADTTYKPIAAAVAAPTR